MAKKPETDPNLQKAIDALIETVLPLTPGEMFPNPACVRTTMTIEVPEAWIRLAAWLQDHNTHEPLSKEEAATIDPQMLAKAKRYIEQAIDEHCGSELQALLHGAPPLQKPPAPPAPDMDDDIPY